MLSNTTKCIGWCLPNQRIQNIGYIPNSDHIFCKNCYQLMHYGKAEGHSHPDKLPNFEQKSLIVVVTSLLYLDMLNSEVKHWYNYKVV